MLLVIHSLLYITYTHILYRLIYHITYTYIYYIDWGKDEEDEMDKKIWEDNWDDDNVEDDFSVQLRYV